MKHLKEYIKKTLAHRHMGHQMIGAVAMNTVRNFLISQGGVTSNEGLGLEGYVRFKVLYLKTSDQALKIEIFKQKNQIIREVNLALEKVGYSTRINEVKIQN